MGELECAENRSKKTKSKRRQKAQSELIHIKKSLPSWLIWTAFLTKERALMAWVAIPKSRKKNSPLRRIWKNHLMGSLKPSEKSRRSFPRAADALAQSSSPRPRLNLRNLRNSTWRGKQTSLDGPRWCWEQVQKMVWNLGKSEKKPEINLKRQRQCKGRCQPKK